jgi:beta-lactamase regulating signal transducer with metallopeptidase domain
MIDSTFAAVAWCMVQVTLIALLGVVASTLFVRRRPRAATTAVSMAVAISALLTLIAPVPVPGCFRFSTSTEIDKPHTRPTIPFEPIGKEELAPSRRISPSTPLMDLTAIAQTAVKLVPTLNLNPPISNPARQLTMGIMIALSLLGLVRLAVAVTFVNHIYRNSIRIQDARILELLDEIAGRFEGPSPSIIYEHPELSDAAVAGWFRPRLILPREWRSWSDEERRTVIAHELAHMQHRDPLWRMMTWMVLALHFYNPVVHWLKRRLVLCQELAADSLAANAVGHRIYLHSLSRLAIRQDNSRGRMASSELVPVFSGDLIPRIKALNSKEGIMEMKSRTGRNGIVAAFAVAGLALLAVRGAAQQSSNDSENHLGSNPRVLDQYVDFKRTNEDPTQAMFRRTSLDPATVNADNSFGMFVFRVGELLNHPEMKSYTPLLNLAIATGLTTELKLTGLPMIQCENIEWIAARPTLTVRAKTKDEKGMVMIGSGGFIVRTRQPFDLPKWIDRFAQDTKSHIVEGKRVFEVLIGALGPNAMYVWMPDDVTLCAAGSNPNREINEDSRISDFGFDPSPSLRTSADSNKEVTKGTSVRREWNPAWKRIDGGLISAVIANFDPTGAIESLDDSSELNQELGEAAAKSLRAVLSRNPIIGYSMDLGQDSKQVGIRVVLSDLPRDDALKTAVDVEVLLRRLAEELRKKADSSNTDASESGGESLNPGSIWVRDTEGGKADVVVYTAIPFSNVVQFFSSGFDEEIVIEDDRKKGVPSTATGPSKTNRR